MDLVEVRLVGGRAVLAYAVGTFERLLARSDLVAVTDPGLAHRLGPFASARPDAEVALAPGGISKHAAHLCEVVGYRPYAP